MIMALTSAEKQQRYRERHLGVHGAKQRIQFFVSVQTKAQLGRLALHHGYTVTKMIEHVIAAAEHALLDQLPRRQHSAYLDSHPNHGASRNVSAGRKPKAKSAKKPTGPRPALRRKVTM
jgi:hypothetical protein